MKGRALACTVLSVAFALAALTPATLSGQAGNECVIGRSIVQNGVEYITHTPIRINSNADFDETHGVINWATGNGTIWNPWVIENWDINGSVLGYCLFIGNTTDYFEIKNCYLHNATGPNSFPYFENAGIHLYYVSNGKIDNNTAESNDYSGLYLYYSDYNSIINNSIYDNNWGIDSEASNNNTYIRNIIYENDKGLWLGWTGATIGSHFNFVSNNNVSNNLNGITIDESNNNIVLNNTASWNDNYGVRISTSFNNIVCNNNASYNNGSYDDSGIMVSIYSADNYFSNNTLLNNYVGIFLYYAPNNTFINNKMIGGGIYFWGAQFPYNYNTEHIDTSNTVNGKPVYYWKNQSGGTVPSNAGQVILSNCTDITVDNFTLANLYCGVQLCFSDDNTISNVVSVDNIMGIQTQFSHNNTIKNCNLSYNENDGLFLYKSDWNDVTNNNIEENGRFGIIGTVAKNNTLHNNSVSYNVEYGIKLNGIYKYDNFIFHNNFVNNGNQSYDAGTNFWNLSYPRGGNYWSDYTGVDLMSGEGQDQPGSDGFGDTNYSIPGEGGCADNYPLMMPIEFEFMNHNYSLSEGWNLISLPFIQCNESIETILSSIAGKWDYIQVYNAADPDHWKTNMTYRPDQLNDLEMLNHKMGFWINITQTGVVLTVSGYVPSSTAISLHAGWNLVGYPTLNDTETVGNALWGTGADRVEVFDATDPYRLKEVGSTYVMKPGEGYWVHVVSDTVWFVGW